MGCDVHMVLEQRHGNKWVGIHDYPHLNRKGLFVSAKGVKDTDDVYVSVVARMRNYRFFGEICDGVRGSSSLGFTERGVPEDASDLTNLRVSEWQGDGHSHSWLWLGEMLAAYGRATREEKEQQEEEVKAVGGEVAYAKYIPHVTMVLDEYEVTADNIHNYRVVFWFDN